MDSKNIYGYFESPLGTLKYAFIDDIVTELDFTDIKKYDIPQSKVKHQQLEDELNAYFNGHLKEFQVKVQPSVTAFREQVLSELMKIPYGKTATYSELANNIHKPKAYRAVAQALHNNPIAIIIPCHRIIGKDGKLVGYGGGLDKKEWLLNLEQKNIN